MMNYATITMNYATIQPPFTLKFEEMPKKELKAYRDWFHSIMSERIAQLERVVKHAPGFENWKADYTPDSLESLGQWFERQVETRPKTKEEIDEIKSTLEFPIDIPKDELTNRTFSLAMDIGMYFRTGCVEEHSWHALGSAVR